MSSIEPAQIVAGSRRKPSQKRQRQPETTSTAVTGVEANMGGQHTQQQIDIMKAAFDGVATRGQMGLLPARASPSTFYPTGTTKRQRSNSNKPRTTTQVMQPRKHN